MMTNQAEALAVRISKPRPTSQTRCRSPLARCRKKAKLKATKNKRSTDAVKVAARDDSWTLFLLAKHAATGGFIILKNPHSVPTFPNRHNVLDPVRRVHPLLWAACDRHSRYHALFPSCNYRLRPYFSDHLRSWREYARANLKLQYSEQFYQYAYHINNHS